MKNYISPSRRGFCTGCADVIGLTKTSAVEPYCRACRAAGKADVIVHGTVRRGYRKGCRCADCRAANTESVRRYVARREQRTGRKQPSRAKVERHSCDQCGVETWSKASPPMCTGCSSAARRLTRISEVARFAIYDRDGWVCGWCECPVDRSLSGMEEWGPTLDHVLPRSHGGTDEAHNLRLLHRRCNTSRSNRRALTAKEAIA